MFKIKGKIRVKIKDRVIIKDKIGIKARVIIKDKIGIMVKVKIRTMDIIKIMTEIILIITKLPKLKLPLNLRKLRRIITTLA